MTKDRIKGLVYLTAFIYVIVVFVSLLFVTSTKIEKMSSYDHTGKSMTKVETIDRHGLSLFGNAILESRQVYEYESDDEEPSALWFVFQQKLGMKPTSSSDTSIQWSTVFIGYLLFFLCGLFLSLLFGNKSH